MAWKDLNMNEKAAYISIAVLNGLLDRESIIRAYNKFNKEGDLKFYGNRYDGDTMPSQLMQVAPVIIGRRPLTEEEKQFRVMYDTEGNPILLPTHGLYNMDTNELINRDFWENGKYIYDGTIHLPPGQGTNQKNIAWYNGDMFGHLLGDLRTNLVKNALIKNPDFSNKYDVLNNALKTVNLASVGALNRLSPSQNIGLVIDAFLGDNIMNSWFGNSGIVSDKFLLEHPYWSMAINGIGDAASYSLLNRFRTTSLFRDPTKVYHSDKGNGTGFTGNGAYTLDGYLHPGLTRLEGQSNYIWWNEGEPFSPGFSPKNSTTRMIVADTDMVPGLMRVRDLNYRIGQWNPAAKKSFVRTSEMVTPKSVPMENLDVYRRIPRTELWFRTNTAGPLGWYGMRNLSGVKLALGVGQRYVVRSNVDNYTDAYDLYTNGWIHPTHLGYALVGNIKAGKVFNPTDVDLNSIGMIKSSGKIGGVSEDLYNAIIGSTGNPILSGDDLLMPEVTTRVWEHFPNRTLIDKLGTHNVLRETNSGRTLRIPTPGLRVTLNSPSRPTYVNGNVITFGYPLVEPVQFPVAPYLIGVGASNNIYATGGSLKESIKTLDDRIREGTDLMRPASPSLTEKTEERNSFSDYLEVGKELIKELGPEYLQLIISQNPIIAPFIRGQSLQKNLIEEYHTALDMGKQKWLKDKKRKVLDFVESLAPIEILKSAYKKVSDFLDKVSSIKESVLGKDTEPDTGFQPLEQFSSSQLAELTKQLKRLSASDLRESSMKYLKSLDKELVYKLLKNLAEAGYYDISLEGLSKEEIKQLQGDLIRKGYLPRGEDDGIIGPKTLNAYNKYIRNKNQDGKVGQKTLDAYLKSLNHNSVAQENIPIKSAEGIDGCALWVTLQFESMFGKTSKLNGVISNAWLMIKNIEDAGGTILYNIYDLDFAKADTVTKLKNLTESKLRSNKLDYSELQIGDIVGIYMPSSNMHLVALNEGTTKNTHVGIITGFDKNGIPLVTHNIYGKERSDSIFKISGSSSSPARVTAVARPKAVSSLAEFIPMDFMESSVEVQNAKNSESLQRYLNGTESSKIVLSKIFPNIDLDIVQSLVIGVLQRETGMLGNKVSDLITLGGFAGLQARAKNSFKNLVREIKGLDDTTKSSNMGKMKYSSLNPTERRFLGIQKPSDLEIPETAGKAAMYLLSKNYDYFYRLSQNYPELGLTEEDLKSLTILSYNLGMNKLTHIGFNNKTGEIDLNEIEELRKLQDPNYRVKDVTSTNWRFLGSLGEFIYDKISDGSESYISSGLRNAQRVKKKV